MIARDTAKAHELIESKLGRIPEADRAEVASQILGALTGGFMLIPHPTVADEEKLTRAQAETVLPWLFPARGDA